MDQGSTDANRCGDFAGGWLPLLSNATIIEQPVSPGTLAVRYARAASKMVETAVALHRPLFLYMPFSHMHQLCSPSNAQWASSAFNGSGGPYVDGVEEMDWITGQVLNTIESAGIRNSTLVIWLADNGPWTQ